MALPGVDNLIAALGQSNRVCQVRVDLAGWQLKEVLAAMHVPFPELTDLRLFANGEKPVIPDSFLGGSAPRLQYLLLDGIPFRGLPKLLLSATHLVYLELHDIPHSGYISPEAMVALLSVSSSLEILFLIFESHQSRPGRESRSLPPLQRSILPALYELRFTGVTEYLEELVTYIDTPQLDDMDITFFDQIDCYCPRLTQFINHTPNLRARDSAHVLFDNWSTSVALVACSTINILKIVISSRTPDRQLSSVAQVCDSSLYPLSTVKDLYIEHQHWRLVWEEYPIGSTLWLRLLLPFTAVKNLYLSEEFAPGIASALQEPVGSRITEVLPRLQNIFVEELDQLEPFDFRENIQQFIVARQLSDRPITVSVWTKNPT
jgi:hypothetical protein